MGNKNKDYREQKVSAQDKCDHKSEPCKDFLRESAKTITWQEKEKKLWDKASDDYNENYRPMLGCCGGDYCFDPKGVEEDHCDRIYKYWITRMESARHEGAHEMDTKVTENFNRALKDESSELIEIIKQSERQKIHKELIEIADAGELEDLRRGVEFYFKNLK